MEEIEYIEVPKKEGDYYLYMGDYIKSINVDRSNNTITFIYVLGGEYLRDENGNLPRDKNGKILENAFKPNTGIEYKEAYNFSIKEKKITFEGKEFTLYYEDIDFESKKVSVYNKELGLYRDINLSNIIFTKQQDIWNSNDACYTPVFKNDNLMGFTEKPTYNINVEVDRGGMSIDEKHFKLSECNTFEDLLNYGNNYFGLE